MSNSRPVSGVNQHPTDQDVVTQDQDTIPAQAVPPSPPGVTDSQDVPLTDDTTALTQPTVEGASTPPDAPIQDTVPQDPAALTTPVDKPDDPLQEPTMFATAGTQPTMDVPQDIVNDVPYTYTDQQILPTEITPFTGAYIAQDTPTDTNAIDAAVPTTTAALATEGPPASDTSTPPGVHTHLPIAASFLEPPRASFLASDISTPRDSYVPPSPNNSTHLLAEKQAGSTTASDVEEPAGGAVAGQRKPLSKRPVLLAFIGALVLLIVAAAVVVPIYFTVIKKNGSNASAVSNGGGGSPTGTAPGSSPTSNGPTTGGDGSLITTETGETFTYKNPFGGFWVSDPKDPYNNNAQPNSWTPPLNQSWKWGVDKIYGVNLGGLFVLEPFISPIYYQKYTGAVDEWTLSTLMAADTASGGLGQLENHYNTFVTEKDIAEMAGAGLNWIRLPIPFWCIETWPGEPFLAKTSWKYILRLLGWARKYGLRVNLDLHTIPGSQNGYNHSGRVGGTINFLFGIMGIANAQRTLGYIRIITEFISQPEWQPVVPMFGVVNEPIPGVIGQDILTHFYYEVHSMMRGITGIGENKGPFISIHDGFISVRRWADFLPGADRFALDSHPYIAFNQQPNLEPIATGLGTDAGGDWPARACAWGAPINQSQTDFGFTYAGEWSNAFNDCGTFVHGVGGDPATYGGDCADWMDASGWNDTTKAGIQAFSLATMDALQNWFFWTWKIGNASSGHVEAPLWSYQLGLENGWMPTDPRTSVGKCAQAGVVGVQFDGTFQPWQTGGVGAGTISANASSLFAQWPPASLNGLPDATDVPLLPTYTTTGPVLTLPVPTFTAATIDVGDGWFNTNDNSGGVTPVAGCTYPDPWSATGIPIPTACTPAAAAVKARALVTPPPVMRR